MWTNDPLVVNVSKVVGLVFLVLRGHPSRGELLLLRALPRPDRPQATQRGARVVREQGGAEADPPHQPPPLPPQRVLPGGLRVPRLLPPSRAARVWGWSRGSGRVLLWGGGSTY